MERLKNIEMKEYTSFKAGGKAAELIIVESVDELRQVLAEIDREQKPYLILGNGEAG